MKDASISVLHATPELERAVFDYCEGHSMALPDHITGHHASVSAERADARMLSSNLQSRLHIFLARALGLKRVLDVGLYLGYSAMVWSHAVGPDGRVTSLEVSPELAAEAERVFAAKGIANIDVVVGDAVETLAQLRPETAYDGVFLDANKEAYPLHLERLLALSRPGDAGRLLRPGALIVADNVLRWGHVPEPGLTTSYWDSDEVKRRELEGLRRFNDRSAAEARLEVVMLPIWDGVTLMRLVD